jgi:2-succinyl-5-enolpyruvyl-6-hydroxy-3-cyclohexene-1-carboxylate synthase
LRLQAIYDIAEICSQQGVKDAVLCPGSRCAPLTIAFTRHSGISCHTFSDERSAGFIALGMAQRSNLPVSIVCTSGSAAYNFAPSIAEAFFQEVPLLVFTADRPAEWIDQWDGQTIRQNTIFGSHVKKSYTLPQEYDHPDSHWHIGRVINEAIAVSSEFPKGPVHINVPLREPLYPLNDEIIQFSKIKKITISPSSNELNLDDKNTLSKSLANYSKILVLGGQQLPQDVPYKSIRQFCKAHNTVLVGDVISNLHGLPDTIRYADTFLSQRSDPLKQALAPELLITFGKSVISKQLKLFLRQYKPKEHWHIQPNGITADTFQSLTRLIHATPKSFFEQLNTPPVPGNKIKLISRENYQRLWKVEERRNLRATTKYFGKIQFSEFYALKKVIDSLPAKCNLHLSNSMSVRYANYIGLTSKRKNVRVFANRGTSGIDGCTSTAIGHSINSDVPNILITGDMAFFYDRNAFWHNYAIPNFRVMILNNQGGVIFNIIDGPSELAEKNEYFITKQKLTASHLAAEFDFKYLKVDSLKRIPTAIKIFYEFDGKTKLLEVISDQRTAKKTFEAFKKTIKKGYEA